MLVALCRPYRDGGRLATPASNAQIAAELFVSVDAVRRSYVAVHEVLRSVTCRRTTSGHVVP
ncbi:MAG: hypothetical protein ACXVXL_11985, partial [Solirubrobacteraceae bacterium]